MSDMENARKKLIKHQYKDYDEKLKRNLSLVLPKEKYLTRISPKTKGATGKAEIKDLKVKRDVAIKAEKSVQHKSAVNYNDKNEHVVSEAQGNTDDKTAVKDHAEDRDVTIKGEKTVEDKMAVTDNSKYEDVATEAQTTITEDNRVKDSKSKRDGKDVASKEKSIGDITVVKVNSKGGAIVSEVQKNTGDKTEDYAGDKDVGKNNHEVNVSETDEFTDAVTKAIDSVNKAMDVLTEAKDALTETSSKMCERKKLMMNVSEKITKANREVGEIVSIGSTDVKAVAQDDKVKYNAKEEDGVNEAEDAETK